MRRSAAYPAFFRTARSLLSLTQPGPKNTGRVSSNNRFIAPP